MSSYEILQLRAPGSQPDTETGTEGKETDIWEPEMSQPGALGPWGWGLSLEVASLHSVGGSLNESAVVPHQPEGPSLVCSQLCWSPTQLST